METLDPDDPQDAELRLTATQAQQLALVLLGLKPRDVRVVGNLRIRIEEEEK